MSRIIIVFYVITLAVALRSGGFTAFLPLLVIGLPVVGFLLFWTRRQSQLREAANRIDDLYIVALPPGEDELYLSVDPDYYVTADHGKVNQVSDKWIQRFIKAGNLTGVTVRRIYWRDGANVGETLDEYRIRAATEILEGQKTRHTTLKQESGDWYVEYHHKENGNGFITIPKDLDLG